MPLNRRSQSESLPSARVSQTAADGTPQLLTRGRPTLLLAGQTPAATTPRVDASSTRPSAGAATAPGTGASGAPYSGRGTIVGVGSEIAPVLEALRAKRVIPLGAAPASAARPAATGSGDSLRPVEAARASEAFSTAAATSVSPPPAAVRPEALAIPVSMAPTVAAVRSTPAPESPAAPRARAPQAPAPDARTADARTAEPHAASSPARPSSSPSPARPGAPSETRESLPAAEPGLFRQAVVEARRSEGPEVDFMAGLKPKSWGILLLLVSLVGLLFAGAALLTIETTAQAQGTLRAPKGLRPVASVLGGSITELLVQNGDQVQAGQVVARLEATELRAGLVNRQRELEITQRDVTSAAQRDREIEERASLAMRQRRSALAAQIAINNERVAQRRAQSQNYDQLVREGGASQTEGLTVKEALQAASENVSALSAQLALLDLDIADRARQWQERQAERRAQLSRAEASVEEAQALLASTEIRAPAAGQVESLLVSPGSVVEAGARLANVVPSGAPLTIVAFVPSREIAFLAPGASATVEVQSLSVSEFGLATARVTRVSSDVATPDEVQATLGEATQGAVVRVELTLVDSEASGRMQPHLRSGERVTVRLHRRQQRLLTLLFDFVRGWAA